MREPCRVGDGLGVKLTMQQRLAWGCWLVEQGRLTDWPGTGAPAGPNIIVALAPDDCWTYPRLVEREAEWDWRLPAISSTNHRYDWEWLAAHPATWRTGGIAP